VAGGLKDSLVARGEVNIMKNKIKVCRTTTPDLWPDPEVTLARLPFRPRSPKIPQPCQPVRASPLV